MTMLISPLARLLRDKRGSAAIETAFVLPILATMVLGSLEVSKIVSRQSELQTAASEATAVVLARPPKEASDRAQIEAIVESSTGLPADNVSMRLRYRCDTEATLRLTALGCGSTAVVSEFIIIQMTDTYTPTWTSFGVGGPINFQVTRRVQIS